MGVRGLKAALACGAMAASFAAASPASALNIVLNADKSFASQPGGAQALFAFRKAANFWNTFLTNDTTLNFNVSYDRLAENVIGSTGSNGVDLTATSVYKGLANNAHSALDRTAVANLHPLTAAGGVGYRAPGANANGLGANIAAASVYDNDDSYNNRYISANTAEAKVLGIKFNPADTFNVQNGGTAEDADITFSSAFDFDFNPTNGLSTGSEDFIAVAVHEMGHALGFVSGADTYDYFGGAGPGVATGDKLNFNDYSILSVWDLFRYSTNPPSANGFDPKTGKRFLQLDPGRGAGFSVDGVHFFNTGGPGGFDNFSTGAFNGDGAQASHWKDAEGFSDENGCFVTNTQIGIMDPTSGDCQPGFVTNSDLAAFDAMGYNLNYDVLKNPNFAFSSADIYKLAGLATVTGAVPEPATWMQLTLGIGLLGGVARRRRSTSTVATA